MPKFCAVYRCCNRSNREKDKRFFRVPKVVCHKGVNFKKLTEKRRQKWIRNLRLKTGGAESANARVCSDHFVTGCPSAAVDVDSQDWAPTVNLGYERSNERQQTEASRQQGERAKARELLCTATEEEADSLQDDLCDESSPIPENERFKGPECQTTLTVVDLTRLEDAVKGSTTEICNQKEKVSATEFAPETFQNKMEGRECCVKNCDSSSHDQQCRMLLNGLSFHCFPAWRTNEGALISELTRRRRAAWVDAVGRGDVTFDRIPSSMRVCSRHFVSGKPAFEMLDADPDWVPSQHLGCDDEGNSWKKIRRLSSEEKPAEGADGAAEVRRPPPPRWREVKSGLQSLLEGKTVVGQRPGDEAQSRGARERTDARFRDFFKNALESSLEASIQARAQSKSRSSSAEYEVQLNFKLPLPEGEPAGSRDSSSCGNCSRMLRRIKELERKLFEVASRQEPSAAGTQRCPDEEEEEDNIYESTGHVGPVKVLDMGSEGEPDTEAAPFSSDPSSPSLDLSPPSPDSAPSTSRPPPHRRRFRKEWLKVFPFLRYSPSLDVMWCHVCRVHSGPLCQSHRLIKGSNHFSKFNIMQHTNSVYHQQNMQRFLWSSREPLEDRSDQGSTR